MNNELDIIKQLETFIDHIISSHGEAEYGLIDEVFNIEKREGYIDIKEEYFYDLFPNIIYNHTLGNKKGIEEILLQRFNMDEFWDRKSLESLSLSDKKIQGNVVETAVDILLRDNDNYLIDIGQEIINENIAIDSRRGFDVYKEKARLLKQWGIKSYEIELKPEYDNNWNGDFGIYMNKVLLGHLDIKSLDFFDEVKEKYRDDFHIIQDGILKGVKRIQNWGSVTDIIKHILQSLTYDYRIGWKNQPTNRELIFIFKDGGYWSSEVLRIIKPTLLNYLKERIR